MTGTATTFVAALLPADWGDRAPLLAAAGRVDLEHADWLLTAWLRWRGAGTFPPGATGDLVRGLAVALGDVAHEARATPRALTATPWREPA